MLTQNEFVSIGATTFLAPIPTVLVGCAQDDGWHRGEGAAPNLITVAWAGICCTKPPMLSIAVRPERYSRGLIERTGEFTVNLVNQALCKAMDYCGVTSGRDVDKFQTLGLTPIAPNALSAAPAIGQAPVYLSCKVRNTLALGSHDLIIAEIVDVCVQQRYMQNGGGINEEALELVTFVHGKYQAVSKPIGFFGYSIASEEVLKRRLPQIEANKGKVRRGKRSGKK